MTNNEIEKIIYAKEYMEEVKDKLVDCYVKDYGSSYKEIIEQRLQHTIYFTDSTPDLTYEVLNKYNKSFKTEQEYDNMVMEYLDYIKVNEKLVLEKRDKYIKFLCQMYGINEDRIRKSDILIDDLLLDSFSSNVISIIDSPATNERTKQKIKHLQDKYYDQCDNLGVRPITSSKIIDFILERKNNIEIKYRIKILKETLWGNRLYNYFVEKSGLTIRDIKSNNLEKVLYCWLQMCLFLPNRVVGSRVFNKKLMINYVSIKLLENLEFDLNHFYYHEMRHVVEGNSSFSRKYKILNELRVDNHANKDRILLPNIFDGKEKVNSLYQKMLPLTKGVFDEYANIFDVCVMGDNLEELEKIVGKENLESYSRMFEEMLKISRITTEVFVDPYSYFEKSDKIKYCLKKSLVRK